AMWAAALYAGIRTLTVDGPLSDTRRCRLNGVVHRHDGTSYRCFRIILPYMQAPRQPQLRPGVEIQKVRQAPGKLARNAEIPIQATRTGDVAEIRRVVT